MIDRLSLLQPKGDKKAVAEDKFNLQSILDFLGFGVDNDGDKGDDGLPEEQQAILDFVKSQVSSKKDYKVPPSNVLARKLLYKLKSKGPNQNKGDLNRKEKCKKKPLSLSVIRVVIQDCIKDILKSVNSNATLIPVDKARIEKSRQDIQKLLDDFRPQLEEKYDALKEALESIKNFNVKDKKAEVQDLIEDSIKKIQSLVDFYKGTSLKYDDQLKTVKELVNDNIKNYTDKILSSNCISVRKSPAAFCKCVEPIYNEFTKNLSKSIEKVDELSKTIQILGREALKQAANTINKELKEAEENAQKLLDKIADLIEPNTKAANEEFLKNRSSNAKTLIESMANKPIVDFKNNLNEQKQAVLNSLATNLANLNDTQVPLREAIDKYLPEDPAPETKKLETYLQVKGNDLKVLVDQTEGKLVNAEKGLESLQNKVNLLTQEYSPDKVNEKCKKEKVNLFIICVNSSYNELDTKINDIVKEIENVYVNVNTNTIEKDLNSFNENTDKILKDAVEDAKKEAKRIVDEAEIKRINNQLISDAIKNVEIKINTEVNPLVAKIENTVINITTNLDAVLPNLVDSITGIITANTGPLTEEDKNFIRDNVDKIKNIIYPYKYELNNYLNDSKTIEDDFRKSVGEVNGPYLKQKCQTEFLSVEKFAACVNVEIGKVNAQTDNVVVALSGVIDKLNVDTGVTIQKEVASLLEKANEIYTAKKQDTNTPEDSATRIAQCIDLVNLKANSEIKPIIEAVFVGSQSIRNKLNKQVDEALPVIKRAIKDKIESIDKLIILNPAETEKYNQLKAELNALLRVGEDRITNSVAASLDKLNTVEMNVQNKQQDLLTRLGNFKAESLNQTCEASYKSKASFSVCIQAECDKFNTALNDIEKDVTGANNDAKVISEELEKYVTNTIQEVKDKALVPNTFVDEINRLEVKQANDEYVQIVLNNSAVKINTQVNPTLNNANTVFTKLNTEFDKVPSELESKLTAIILTSYEPGVQLSDEDKLLIKQNVDNINKLINDYKQNVNQVGNEVKQLDVDFKTTASVYDKPYVDNKCQNDSSAVSTFRRCVDVTIANLEKASDKVVKDVTDLLNKVENIKVNTDITITQDIASLVQSVTEVYTMNRLARDENNATTSAGFISECLNSVNKRINQSLTQAVVEALSLEKDLVKYAKEQSDAAAKIIRASYTTELEALDFAITLNPKESVKYNNKKAAISASIDAALKRLYDNVNANLNSFAELTAKVNKLNSELSARQAAFNANLNKSCEAVYSSKKNYSKCIDEKCANFNSYLNATEIALGDLSTDANLLFVNELSNITANVESEKTQAADTSRKEIETLFKDNNVNAQSVINVGLSDLARFNVTPYFNAVNLVNNRAVELRARSNTINNTGNSIINRVSLLLSLHEFAAFQICPKVPIKNELNTAAALIQAAKNRVWSLFPNNTQYISDEINLAADFNNTLKVEIQKLQPESIKVSCGNNLQDLVKLLACVKGLVGNFGQVFNMSRSELNVEAQNALFELNTRTEGLNQWRDIKVQAEYNNLSKSLVHIPEDIYTGACNATKEKMLDFAMLQVDNRYNRLKPVINNLARNVTAAADVALSRNYKNVVDINEKLNGSVNWLRLAIAEAQKKNPSYVTREVLEEPGKNIGIGIRKFNSFIEQIPVNASLAKTTAQNLVAQSEEWYKNSNKSAASDACYNETAVRPRSAFIVCNNGFAYNFELGLADLQAKLEESLKKLQTVNALDGKKAVQEYADELAAELKLYSAQYAIKIYSDVGLEIPDYLKPYLKNSCLASSGINNINCIIQT